MPPKTVDEIGWSVTSAKNRDLGKGRSRSIKTNPPALRAAPLLQRGAGGIFSREVRKRGNVPWSDLGVVAAQHFPRQPALILTILIENLA